MTEKKHNWLRPWEDGSGWWFYTSAFVVGAALPVAVILYVWLGR